MPDNVNPKNLPPCKHMEPMLQAKADGSLRGFKSLFTWFHMLHCGPCRRFFMSIEQIVARLRGIKPEPEDAGALARLREQIAASQEG
jgi:hypothetical protein